MGVAVLPVFMREGRNGIFWKVREARGGGASGNSLADSFSWKVLTEAPMWILQAR
jgi:hypothetical protein